MAKITAAITGVQGYVLKETAGDELAVAIRAAYAHSRYLSPKLLHSLDGAFISSAYI